MDCDTVDVAPRALMVAKSTGRKKLRAGLAECGSPASCIESLSPAQRAALWPDVVAAVQPSAGGQP